MRHLRSGSHDVFLHSVSKRLQVCYVIKSLPSLSLPMICSHRSNLLRSARRSTAGFGKTVLAAHLASRLQDVGESDIVLLVHFRPNTDVRWLLVTLLLQFLRHPRTIQTPSFLQHVDRLREQLQQVPEVPLKLLWEILTAILETQLSFSIIIDGLDECCFSLENEMQTSQRVIQSLKALTTTGKGRVIVLCRPDLKRSIKRSGYETITVKPQMLRGDIMKHFNSLYNIRQLPQELWGQAYAQVKSKADGSFQWVLMYIKYLDLATSQSKLRERICSFPGPLSEAYDKLIADREVDLDNDAKEQRNNIFVLIQGGRRTLFLEELIEILDLPPQKTIELIARLCGPFVEVHDDHRVGFTHSSIKDYFHLPASRSRFSLNNPDYYHAKKGLNYLLQPEFASLDFVASYLRKNNQLPPDDRDDNPPPFDDKHKFLEYASTHWFNHVVALSSPPPEIVGLVEKFIESNQSVFWAEYITNLGGSKELALVAERKLRKWLQSLSADVSSGVHLENFIVKPYPRVSEAFAATGSNTSTLNTPSTALSATTASKDGKVFHFLTLMGLGDYFYEKGDTQAFSLRKRVAAGMIDLLGEDDRLTLKARSQEAAVYLWEGKMRRALELLKRLVASQRLVLGEDASEVWQSTVHIGRAKFYMLDLDGASETYQRALEGLERTVGIKDPFYTGTLVLQAEVLSMKREYGLAISLLKKLYEDRVDLFDPEDGVAIWTQAFLGEAYRKNGERKPALEHLRANYEYRQHQSAFTSDYIKVDPGISLIIAYREFRMTGEARSLLVKVMSAFSHDKLPERWCQVVHLDGLLRADGGDIKGSIKMLWDFAFRMPRGDYNRGFMWLLLDLALLLRHVKRDDEARSLFQNIVTGQGMDSVELDDEPSSVAVLELAEEALTLVRKGDVEEANALLEINCLSWVRERDIWGWEAASPADTAVMKPPFTSAT